MSIPPEVARAYPGLEVEAAPWGTGLINLTLKGRMGDAVVVVQRVHPAFAPTVHEDIEAVTAHLERKGFSTTRLVRTSGGGLSTLDDVGRPWRVLRFMPGVSRDRVASPSHAEEAGALVGRFHAAVADLEHTYVHVRAGVHDVGFRLRALESALEAHRRHRLYDAVAPIAESVLRVRSDLLDLDVAPHRHAHGDLKISNLLFDDAGVGVTLVDLDTLARMPWLFEMGDALRSWCNPHGEDIESPAVDEVVFEAALTGWARGAAGRVALDRVDSERVGDGLRTIAVELAVRFLTDALEETYFGWNERRFATRGDHNLARALGQWRLAESARASASALAAVARRALRADQ